MKYKIVSAESKQGMEEAVQPLLDAGWDLYGDLIMVIHPATHRLFYYRELVKYDNSDNMWELLAASVAKQYETLASES